MTDKRQMEQAAMDEALRLAAGHRTHPNPRVGSVVLDASGEIVGRGAHEGPGLPHAEAVALAEAGDSARGGTIVVTLEPCDHHGRTPPCTEAILDAGITRVVAAITDPDPQVSGRGLAHLREAGLEVEAGSHADAAEALDPGYFVHRRLGRPRVTLKWASTLDGQVAAADGTSQWITSPEASRDAHLLRSEADAVMVGAGTVIADDPRLTVRLDGYDGPQPRPVIVAGTRPLDPARALFGRDPIVYTPDDLPGPDGVDLGAALADLGKRDVVDLLVEGGPTLAGALLRDGLADRLVVYLAGSVAGGVGRPALGGLFETIGDQVPVAITDVRRLGPDLRVEATVGRGA
jgi:diaminohydroxyphosphoribosylaminopyrimidine deaminase/5-amino-6-(5-phosphoribosylamino)uracil reductase